MLNMKNRGELPYILCKRALARPREAPPSPGKSDMELFLAVLF
jgi:hypothetical protein